MNARASSRSTRRSSIKFTRCFTKAKRRRRRCRNCSGAIKKRSAFEDLRLILAELCDRRRIQLVLRNLDPRMQSFGGIVGQSRKLALRDDITVIDFFIDIVDGATGYFFASGECLFPRFEPRKFWQQCWMNI